MTLENKVDVIYEWVMAQKGEQSSPDISDSTSYTEIIEDILTKIGIPRSLSGFRYLAWAIEYAILDEGALHNVTNGLYRIGGEHFNTDAKGFERNVRHAICTSTLKSTNRSPEAIRLFGDSVYCGTRITNKAVISTLASEVKKQARLRQSK